MWYKVKVNDKGNNSFHLIVPLIIDTIKGKIGVKFGNLDKDWDVSRCITLYLFWLHYSQR